MKTAKKDLGSAPTIFPAPIFVVGSYNEDGTPNMMTASFGGIVAMKPPALYVSLRKATLTHGNIMRTGVYTVNIPSEKYARESDYVGIVSGRNVNKFETTGLTPVKGSSVDAPYVEEFPVNYECKVIQMVKVGSHTQFIAEIIGIKASEEVLNEKGHPALNKIQPLLMGTSESSYFGMGKEVDKAFHYKNQFPKE